MDFYDFVKKIEVDSDLQKEIKECLNQKEFFNFLKKYHLEKLFIDFRDNSRNLAAEYWPWYGMTSIERKLFFKKEFL